MITSVFVFNIFARHQNLFFIVGTVHQHTYHNYALTPRPGTTTCKPLKFYSVQRSNPRHGTHNFNRLTIAPTVSSIFILKRKYDCLIFVLRMFLLINILFFSRYVQSIQVLISKEINLVRRKRHIQSCIIILASDWPWEWTCVSYGYTRDARGDYSIVNQSVAFNLR